MSFSQRAFEHLGLPGMSVEQATWFRDKEAMKQVLDAAGVRTHGIRPQAMPPKSGRRPSNLAIP